MKSKRVGVWLVLLLSILLHVYIQLYLLLDAVRYVAMLLRLCCIKVAAPCMHRYNMSKQ